MLVFLRKQVKLMPRQLIGKSDRTKRYAQKMITRRKGENQTNENNINKIEKKKDHADTLGGVAERRSHFDIILERIYHYTT